MRPDDLPNDTSSARALSPRLLAAVWLRALFLQTVFTYERYQGAGVGFALLPALKRIWPNAEDLQRAVLRHTDYFNTNPVLAGYILGSAAYLEEQAARVSSDPARAHAAKLSLGGPVAALGDRLLWGTLRPLATSIGILLALQNALLGAFVMLAVYNVPQLALRAYGLLRGARLGPAAIADVTGARFALWTERAAVVWAAAAGVLAGVLALRWLGDAPRGLAGAWLLFSVVSALLFARRRTSPTLLAACGLVFGLIVAAWRLLL
jgi:PTS system sorbose-specific IID component